MISFRTLALAAGLAFISSASLAADLPGRASPPPPAAPMAAPAAFTWTGFYLGDYIGDNFGNPTATQSGGGKTSFNANGFTGGAYAGYNYQIGQFVAGVETEFGYNGASGTKYIGYPFTAKDSQTYDGRVRARGGLAYDNYLLYGALGWTRGDNTLSASAPSYYGLNDSISTTKQLNGYNLGLGVDYAITPHIVLRAEYIYDKMSSATYDLGAYLGATKISATDNTVRVGAAVKF